MNTGYLLPAIRATTWVVFLGLWILISIRDIRVKKILHRDLRANHDTILEIAGWCCPLTRDWIASLSSFDPSMLPVQEAELPLPLVDQTKPAERPERETLGGRKRLSLK